MKRALVLCLGLMLAASAAWAGEEIPKLEGVWKVTRTEFHVKGKDHLGASTKAQWKFSQKGRLVNGEISWEEKGHSGSDHFSGVISKDGKTVYTAGHKEGVRILNIEGPDAMTVYFVVPGGAEPRAGYAELARVK
jgi:hypothetical protein